MSHDSSNYITFQVKVIPRANCNEIIGWEGAALKVRLNAPPIEGRANQALIQFLAKSLDIPRGNVEIVRGQTSRHKVVRVRGLTADALLIALRRGIS